MDNETDTLNSDTTMNKNELINVQARMIKLTRQALANDTNVAQEYYEKVKHLGSIIRMVTNFESQLLFDLDVD